jgi:hypothetical protein
MSNYNKIQWVVQRNLNQNNVNSIKSVCEQIGVDCHLIDIIPFSGILPEFPNDKHSIFYGSTTMMYSVYLNENYKRGLFFDDATFSFANYFDKWKSSMLNFGAIQLTVNDIDKLDYSPDKLLFIRPDADNKSFDGNVKRYNEIKVWAEQIKLTQTDILNTDTEIIISEPYHLKSEWRLWIVEGKVVSASKYRENFRLTTEFGCPQDVIDFAEIKCKEYNLHDVFVMDVGLCADELYIIECNCMNSSGFYKADIGKIISSVTNYFNEIINKI